MVILICLEVLCYVFFEYSIFSSGLPLWFLLILHDHSNIFVQQKKENIDKNWQIIPTHDHVKSDSIILQLIAFDIYLLDFEKYIIDYN